MKKKILVTGGAGFIGSHLCMKLLEMNNEVICMDNFITGNINNINILLKNPHFEIIRHDVTIPLDLDIDEIYNLACPASPVSYQEDPVQTIKTCVTGAINMLELANKLKIKILQASTSEVYGDPEIHPQVEEYWGRVNPIGIRSCYDEGKRCAETLFFDYHRQNNLKIKVARIFNTYGPFMQPDDGRVVSNFIIQALKKDNLTIFGDGNHTRSFCYVEDLVEGLTSLMNSPNDFTGPVNLGNNNETTILELAELIIKLSGSTSGIVFKVLPLDDPQIRCPNIVKAETILGWKAQISLEEGLLKTIDYFRNLLNSDLQTSFNGA